MIACGAIAFCKWVLFGVIAAFMLFIVWSGSLITSRDHKS